MPKRKRRRNNQLPTAQTSGGAAIGIHKRFNQRARLPASVRLLRGPTGRAQLAPLPVRPSGIAPSRRSVNPGSNWAGMRLSLRRCGAAAAGGSSVSDDPASTAAPGSNLRRDLAGCEGASSCRSTALSIAASCSSVGSDSDEGDSPEGPGGCGPRARRESSASTVLSRDGWPGAEGGDDLLRTEHSAATPDGWRLHLLHVRRAAPPAGGPAPARHHPVILCPGLASGGVESFDLHPSVSMAAHLARAGYSVWIPDLRGNGRSDRPSWWDRSAWWTVGGPGGGAAGGGRGLGLARRRGARSAPLWGLRRAAEARDWRRIGVCGALPAAFSPTRHNNPPTTPSKRAP